MIREIKNETDILMSLNIIVESFKTVRKNLNLTINNCPTHPSFLDLDKLKKLFDKGIKFFGYFINQKQIGLIGVENADNNTFYIEKLSVLPEYRHHGYGRELIDYIFKYVKKKNGKKISIAIINEHKILKKWYKEYGFVETSKKKFDHLPFTVCFLEKYLDIK